MRALRRRWHVRLAVVAFALAAAALPFHAAPPAESFQTFIVNSTNDVDDTVCDVTHCSLREAISASNNTAGFDLIDFDLGPGNPTISPTSALPPLWDRVYIRGNTLGATRVQLDGSSAGGFAALWFQDGSDFSEVGALVIRNWSGYGVLVDSGATRVTLYSNYIGTDATGTADAGNAGDGILLLSDFNVVGTPGLPNVLSGNGGSGVGIVNSSMNEVTGNYIGTDVTGSVAIRNDFGGITINASTEPADSNQIGRVGYAPNIISGNWNWGVAVRSDNNLPGSYASGNSIANNYIGVAADGFSPLGNDPYGIHVMDGAVNTLIGDENAGGENIIAHNLFAGIVIQDFEGDLPSTAPRGAHIYANSIHSHDFILGIDLVQGSAGFQGVTTNDLYDGDSGANELQNYPVLSAVSTGGGNTDISGALNSAANQTYQVRVFENPVCHNSGYGEGRTFVGQTSVTTNGTGNGSFSATFAHTLSSLVGVVATATDPLGNTSEFSACFTTTSDSDGDGDMNFVDNCPGQPNSGQENLDRNHIELVTKPYDDLTRSLSDVDGDACDDDIDGDGRTDALELSATGCAGPTDPYNPDSDGDHALDGPECTLGSNPNSAGSEPSIGACGPSTDLDGDKVLGFREVCYYGTDPNTANTDGDTRNDGCEVYSINGDQSVNVIDLQQVAAEMGSYAPPGTAVKNDFDVTKNGAIDVIDLQQIAAGDGVCP